MLRAKKQKLNKCFYKNLKGFSVTNSVNVIIKKKYNVGKSIANYMKINKNFGI